MNMRVPSEPLKLAFDASGMTLDQLGSAAGLTLSRSSLSRKLRGQQGILVEGGEAEAIARVLGFEVVYARGVGFRLKKAA